MEPRGLGKYELRSVLGRGATGTVYEGWDPAIARKVALKTVDLPPEGEAQDELARFRREAQAAGRLSHPGIVAAYDYGETTSLAYIVMEFVDGRTLKSVLDGEERLPLLVALRVMDDVLAALEYSHGRGVVHRDIKPANVILTADGRAKVADFGIARIENSNLTQAGTVMGTPAYMSPEQFMGQVVDRRTDIYACGVLLYQLLTGDRPFEGSLTGIMHKVLNTVPAPPSELTVTSPPALDAVVARAMAKRPDDRYGSAAEFAQAISEATSIPAASVSVQDETVVLSPLPRAAPPRAGRRGLLALGGAGVTTGLGLAAWLLLAPGRVPENPAVPNAPLPSNASARSEGRVKLLPGTPDPSLPSLAGEARQEASTERDPQQTLPPAPRPAPMTSEAPVHPPDAPPAYPSEPPADRAGNTPPLPRTVSPEAPAARVPDAQLGTQIAVVEPPHPPEPPPATPVDPRDKLRTAVASALDSIPCALLGGDFSGASELRLTGLTRKISEPAIRAAVARTAPGYRIIWTVAPFEGADLCPTLDALRPAAGRFGAPTGLSVGTADGRTSYREGENVVLPVEMPGFPAWLRVDYVSGAGTVGHLYPDTATQAPQHLPASARVRVGDAAEGSVTLPIREPYGTDLVVTLATAAPLLNGPRLDDEPVAAYLRDLRAALDAARRDGSPVAAAALVLMTSPMPAVPRR